MNINRNNYEEYFLLYADNELTQTEKKVVEIFVQENVDLKEEFLMIQMTVNSPDKEMKILDKSFLLKKEPGFINENNYEQVFVFYHDNELSEEQKRETEKFVEENSKLKDEFDLIGKAKLVANNLIVFPDKKELYQKEKFGKVVPLILWRSLAAAVFIGFGLWVTVSYFNRNEVRQSIATNVNHTIKKPEIKEAKPDKNIPVLKPENKEESIASSKKIEDQKTRIEDKSEIKKPVVKEEKLNKEPIALIKDRAIEEEIKSVKPDVDYQLATSNQPIKKLSQTIEKASNSLEDLASIQTNDIEPEVEKPNYAQRASYISPANENNDNYVFYDVSTEQFRKSKVGGFLKKVKRVVERNNPITRLFPGDEEQMAAK